MLDEKVIEVFLPHVLKHRGGTSEQDGRHRGPDGRHGHEAPGEAGAEATGSDRDDNSDSHTEVYDDKVIRIVQAGDTLWDLAEKYYGDGNKWKKIARQNKVDDPRTLQIGQRLTIPNVEPPDDKDDDKRRDDEGQDGKRKVGDKRSRKATFTTADIPGNAQAIKPPKEVKDEDEDEEGEKITIHKPYSANSDLPASVRDALPEAAQTIWRKAFNAALTQYGDEVTANKVAWAAVKAQYKQDGELWVKKDAALPEIEFFADEDDNEDTSYHYVITKANDEKRYTLGPVYAPNKLDFHGEFIEPEELQEAMWGYVRKGDRDIHLQHGEEKVGEWVELITWPYRTSAQLNIPGTKQKQKVSFPPGTVFMGVIWEPKYWEKVKAGELTGYSIGGRATRVEVDFKGR